MRLVRVLLTVLCFSVISCGSGPDALPPQPPDTPPSTIAPSGPKPPEQESGFGTIIGEVRYKGMPPQSAVISVTKDTDICGKAKTSESLVVGKDGGVRFVVASVTDLAHIQVLPPPGKPVVLDQKGCWFDPHVVLVPVGGIVEVKNPDGILHNFHAGSHNAAQPKFKKTMQVKFDAAGIFKMACDVHPWMLGWVVVSEHSLYALSDAGGTFILRGVPAGKRTLRVWHETLGEKKLQVIVEPGKEILVLFEFSG
ncbi:MAG: hypothetical protein Q7R73_01030 [bacterium]|nr:hypothetical protein [bacterium]